MEDSRQIKQRVVKVILLLGNALLIYEKLDARKRRLAGSMLCQGRGLHLMQFGQRSGCIATAGLIVGCWQRPEIFMSMRRAGGRWGIAQTLRAFTHGPRMLCPGKVATQFIRH